MPSAYAPGSDAWHKENAKYRIIMKYGDFVVQKRTTFLRIPTWTTVAMYNQYTPIEEVRSYIERQLQQDAIVEKPFVEEYYASPKTGIIDNGKPVPPPMRIG